MKKTSKPTSAILDPKTENALARFGDMSLKNFYARIGQVDWVRGWDADHTAVGIGYIEGKLCKVTIGRSDVGEIESEPITVATAARFIREMMTAEISLRLAIESTDTGLLQWFEDVSRTN